MAFSISNFLISCGRPTNSALTERSPAITPETWGVAARYWEEGNLGLRHGQVLYRPHLVVLPFLAAQVPPGHISPFVDGHPDPHVDCLQRIDDRQRVRRLAIGKPHQSRMEYQFGAQDGDADLCAMQAAGAIRALRAQYVGGGGHF